MLNHTVEMVCYYMYVQLSNVSPHLNEKDRSQEVIRTQRDVCECNHRLRMLYSVCLYHLQNRDTDLQLWHREIRRKTDSRGVIWSFRKQPCVRQKSLDCSGSIDNNELQGIPWEKVSGTEKFPSALSRNTITQWGAVDYMDYNLLQILFICCR